MNSHLDRAERLMNVRRHQKAIPHLLDFLADSPNDARALAMLANCYLNIGQHRQAKLQIEQALHQSPDYAYAHYIHSFILNRLKLRGESRTAINEALRLAPVEPIYCEHSADLWMTEGKDDEAIRDSERGLESIPSHVGCSCNLAFALMRKGKFTASEEVLERILQQHPDHAMVHATYGWVAKSQSMNRVARHHFVEALRIDPEYDWAKSGLRESLNNNFIWRFLEALDGCLFESSGILKLLWSSFSFLCLYGAVYFGIWQGPWLDDGKSKPTTSLDTLVRVIFAIGAITFCLSSVIGKSLSEARLAICVQGRLLMQRHDLMATFVGWLFVLCAAVLLTFGTITMDRNLYEQGCIILWGTIPATWIWKSHWLGACCFFVVATAAYFGSAIIYVPAFTQGIVSLELSPWWHWLTAMFVLSAAGLASGLPENEK